MNEAINRRKERLKAERLRKAEQVKAEKAKWLNPEKFGVYDIPFEMVKIDTGYDETVKWLENGLECENKHVCYSQLRKLMAVRKYTNIRVVFNRTLLTDLEVLKWFSYLNKGYNRKVFTVNFNTREIHIDLAVLPKKMRKFWPQVLNILGMVRYLHEGSQPMVVRGAIYLQDKYPWSNFMHSFGASHLLMYHRHSNSGISGGHSIYSHGFGSTVTFHKFLQYMETLNVNINNAVRQKSDYPQSKHTHYSIQNDMAGYKMTKKFEVNFETHAPLTIIKKWHKELEKFIMKNEPKWERLEKERSNRYAQNGW